MTGALSVALATAFLHMSRAHTGPDVGPTAATLGDAFSTFLGAALGLAGGSGVSAAIARRGSRLATGLIVGFVAYAAVLVPIIAASGPSDVSARESLGVAFLLGVPFGIVVLIASVVGAGIGSARTLGGRRDHKRP